MIYESPLYVHDYFLKIYFMHYLMLLFLIHTLKYMYNVHLTYLTLQVLCVFLKFGTYCWTWTSVLFHFTLMVMYEIVHFGPFHANPRCFRHILTTVLFYQWWIDPLNQHQCKLQSTQDIFEYESHVCLSFQHIANHIIDFWYPCQYFHQ